MEALHRPGSGPVVRGARLRRPPFRLAPSGGPEVAFLWKGLIATGRLANLRVLAVLTLTIAAVAAGLGLGRLSGPAGGGGVPGLVGLVKRMVAAGALSTTKAGKVLGVKPTDVDRLVAGNRAA